MGDEYIKTNPSIRPRPSSYLTAGSERPGKCLSESNSSSFHRVVRFLMRHLFSAALTLSSAVIAADAPHTHTHTHTHTHWHELRHNWVFLNFTQIEDGCCSIMLMSIAVVQSHASATERAEGQTLIEIDHDSGGSSGRRHMTDTVLGFQRASGRCLVKFLIQESSVRR